MICTLSPGYSASACGKYATTVLLVSLVYSFQPTIPPTTAITITTAPTIAAVLETCGSLRFRMLKIVDTGQEPPVSGTRNGGLPGSGSVVTGDSCWPGPGGGGPCSIGTGGTATGAGPGPGAGPSGTVRALIGPSGIATGVPGRFGDGCPGSAAAGRPGAGGPAFGLGADV